MKCCEDLSAIEVIYLLQKAWENGKEVLKLPQQISSAFLIDTGTEHGWEKMSW